jgi:hypothetical protein
VTFSRQSGRFPPFVLGHVAGAFVTGAIAGAFLDFTAVMVFSGSLAASAAVSALVCRWWPGFAAAGWKLWLAGTLGNPLLLAAVAFSVDQYDCLVGERTGWNCMFSDAGPLVAGLCLPPPLVGLALRWWRGRRADSV